MHNPNGRRAMPIPAARAVTGWREAVHSGAATGQPLAGGGHRDGWRKLAHGAGVLVGEMLPNAPTGPSQRPRWRQPVVTGPV